MENGFWFLKILILIFDSNINFSANVNNNTKLKRGF